MTSGTRNFLKGMAFLSPWLIGFALFLFLPILLALYYSFHDYALIQSGPPEPVGWDNYRQMGRDPVFWQALDNTLLYAAMSIPLGLLVSLFLAVLLHAASFAKSFFRTVIFLPALIPAAAAAVLWAWLFNSRYGLLASLYSGLNRALAVAHLHVPSPNWLADYALPALAIMSLWSVGYTVIILLAGLQNVPRELFEAAEIDGASTLRRFWHITLPAISPVIFFNLVMALIATFQVFTVPTLMIKAGMRPDTRFYSMYVFDEAFNYSHMGYASALAWVQMLIIVAFTALAFWSAKKWVHYR